MFLLVPSPIPLELYSHPHLHVQSLNQHSHGEPKGETAYAEFRQGGRRSIAHGPFIRDAWPRLSRIRIHHFTPALQDGAFVQLHVGTAFHMTKDSNPGCRPILKDHVNGFKASREAKFPPKYPPTVKLERGPVTQDNSETTGAQRGDRLTGRYIRVRPPSLYPASS
jgi:hypothetical protein